MVGLEVMAESIRGGELMEEVNSKLYRPMSCDAESADAVQALSLVAVLCIKL